LLLLVDDPLSVAETSLSLLLLVDDSPTVSVALSLLEVLASLDEPLNVNGSIFSDATAEFELIDLLSKEALFRAD
jgi:hypothetical protein